MLDPVTRLLFRDAGRRGPAVLMYHSISRNPEERAWPWAVSLRCFRKHLDLLADGGWNCVRCSELVDGNPLPARTVAISFDDGFRDNIAAVEALIERRMTATWFVISGKVGGEASWIADARGARPLLGASELREMAAAGMEIGSHTRSHASLPTLGASALTEEVAGSRRELEDLLGREVVSFAYPYGAHDAASVRAVAEAGYRAAFTTRSGWALRQNDPFRINRLTVYAGEGDAALARKLALGTNDGDWRAVARYGLARLRS